jgi:hypothetical protein
MGFPPHALAPQGQRLGELDDSDCARHWVHVHHGQLLTHLHCGRTSLQLRELASIVLHRIASRDKPPKASNHDHLPRACNIVLSALLPYCNMFASALLMVCPREQVVVSNHVTSATHSDICNANLHLQRPTHILLVCPTTPTKSHQMASSSLHAQGSKAAVKHQPLQSADAARKLTELVDFAKSFASDSDINTVVGIVNQDLDLKDCLQ